MTIIRLKEARLCLSCSVIHTQWECPVCAKGSSYHIAQWLDKVLKRKLAERKEES